MIQTKPMSLVFDVGLAQAPILFHSWLVPDEVVEARLPSGPGFFTLTGVIWAMKNTLVIPGLLVNNG